MAGKGLLLAMMEPPPALEGEFNDWYDTEHLPERRDVPGFQTAQRYVCISGWPKYLALYDLTAPEVLEGEAYRAISGPHFSPWSQRILRLVVGLYRRAFVQVFPGDAVTGGRGVASALMIVRFRETHRQHEASIVNGLDANFSKDERVLQYRLFASAEWEPAREHVAIIESRVPLLGGSLDPTPFSDSSGHMDLVNHYAPYWRRLGLEGAVR